MPKKTAKKTLKKRETKTPKRLVKKITRRRRKTDLGTFDPKKALDVDQVYKAINKVQLAKQEVTFIVMEGDAAVVENIIKDLRLDYRKSRKVAGCPDCTEFFVKPGPDKYDDRDFDDVNEFPDEIKEEGQIFFD